MFKNLILAALTASCLLCSCGTSPFTAEIDAPTIPLFIDRDNEEILDIYLIMDNAEDYTIKTISFSLEGTTDINNITEASVNIEKKYPGKTGSIINIPIGSTYSKDSLKLSLCLKIEGTALLKNTIRLSNLKISTDKGTYKARDFSKDYRLAVALRESGDDGSKAYRIPGLTTSKSGTLIAMFDKRIHGYRDLQGNIDLCIRRSLDKGQTWLPMQTVMDMGEYGGLPQKYNGVSDGSILSDENTGDLYLFGNWMHGILDPETGKWVEGLTEESQEWNHQWASRGSQPGYGLKESSQFLVCKSTDDGQTWSEPENITTQVKKKEHWLMSPAPGHGITLEDGTLVIPGEGRTETGLQFGTIIYSKDGGKSWHSGNPAYYNANEGMAVQLSDGSIMLNIRERSNNGKIEGNGRAIAVTQDLGQTWTEHHTSRSALIEPACMASLHKHNYSDNKHILLFLNPNSRTERHHMTLKCSYDDGDTWPEDCWLLLDEHHGNGYSCITSIDENTIGVLYEGSGADLVFQQIDISHLLK